jgi:hypothetical protein
MVKRFGPVVEQLVQEVEGLRSSIGPLMHSATFNARFNSFLLSRFLEDNGENTGVNPEGESEYRIGPEHFGKLRRIQRGLNSAISAQALIPSSLLVTLVSRFDAFLGRIIRVMIEVRPELIGTGDRALTLKQLNELGDYDAAREFLIEKEIESVLRKSHSEHFDWLESRLDIPLRKDLPAWKAFVELTERRNLLVHCDGIVSHQYLSNCREAKVDTSTIAVGSKLDVPHEYFRSACDCILEIGVKLTHVIWRKLLPDDREAADDALNTTGFELIIHENFRLAKELLRFSSSVIKKHASERHRLMFLVNWAQACKWGGGDTECNELLANEDWSAKGQEFQICAYALMENYEKTCELMRAIGDKGSVKAVDYREWPVFRKARREKSFTDTYKNIFGEEMRSGEHLVPVTQKQLEEFLSAVPGTLATISAQATSDEIQNNGLHVQDGDSSKKTIVEHDKVN